MEKHPSFNALPLLLLLLLGAACVGAAAAAAIDNHDQNHAVVVEREEVCIVGREEVQARYCARLALKDIGTGEGFLRHLSWLRFENTNVLLPGDASGPLGTCMVISLKNHVAGSKDLNDTSLTPSSRADLLSMNLARTELLLKEIVGGEAIGWGRSGPLDLDERVIKSPFKTMVLLQGGVGLGAEMEALVPTSFKDFMPDTSAQGSESGPSTLGLWHWLPSNGPQEHDSWPSFFLSLGATAADSKVEKRGRFLPKWLAKRASLWGPELSSSQWQVHQRSLTLVSPQDKRKSLSLTYCESAHATSPPKSTSAPDAANESAVLKDSQLHVKRDSTDLSNCTTAGAVEDETAGLWVLQDIQRTLVGNGAHRVVRSVVTLSGSLDSAQGASGACHLRLLERLPTGVFADQFELQGIRRRGGLKEAWIHGDINLEQPALLSTQSIVVVHVPLQKVQGDGGGGSATLLQAEVALPLHARYPPLTVGSHSSVHIPLPHMSVSCQQEGIALPVAEPGSPWKQVVVGDAVAPATRAQVLDWRVPSGNPADYGFVARFTAIAALTGVLVVFAASVSAERRD